MATENKEKAKGEAIFPLTQEQINQIAAIGAKEGVRAYKEEQKKEERRRKKEDSKDKETAQLVQKNQGDIIGWRAVHSGGAGRTEMEVR